MLGKRRKKTDLPAVCAVIVAAGSSRRMGGENKLLLEIDGVPVLARTLSAFQKCAAIRDIVLVCREQDIMPYTELAKAFSIDKLCTVTRGGETRTESVLAGITAAPENAVLVAVHDGARPLVSEAVITEAVTTAAEYGAAAPVVPVKDSIKRIEGWQYRRRCRPRHACRGTDPAGIPQGPAPPCAHLGGRARLQLHRRLRGCRVARHHRQGDPRQLPEH